VRYIVEWKYAEVYIEGNKKYLLWEKWFCIKDLNKEGLPQIILLIVILGFLI
jgi:hypothetical protein